MSYKFPNHKNSNTETVTTYYIVLSKFLNMLNVGFSFVREGGGRERERERGRERERERERDCADSYLKRNSYLFYISKGSHFKFCSHIQKVNFPPSLNSLLYYKFFSCLPVTLASQSSLIFIIYCSLCTILYAT